MGDYISGVKDRYPEILLKGRLPIEGNVIGCFFQDPLLLDETTCTEKDFITYDGRFYFRLIKALRDRKISEVTEVDVQALKEKIYGKFQELGGWESIEQLKEVVNLKNFDVYIDTLYRENILLHLYDDGFNLINEIEINSNKKVSPIKLLRKMNSEEVLDWWESRLSTYGNGYSASVIEDEIVDYDEDFLQSCIDGEENGVPFNIAGLDVNGDDINCFPFLSNQINGMLPGTMSMIGGFSSAGKSTWLITFMMALFYRNQKIILISNEERLKRFKIKFIVWILGKVFRYFKLSKKKISSGDFTEEDVRYFREAMKYFKENIKGKLRIVTINDANMIIVKKKIREAALRDGFTCFIYDTFKIEEKDFTANRTDLALVRDSRTLATLAQKYNMIGMASVQLAEGMRGTLALQASVLSNSKQLKEVLENLFLMRSIYQEELDSKNKYYCRPYRLKKIDDKWVEEPYELDPNGIYRMLFVEKGRAGPCSSDNGSAYILKYSGDFCIFRETAQCHFKHGRIE